MCDVTLPESGDEYNRIHLFKYKVLYLWVLPVSLHIQGICSTLTSPFTLIAFTHTKKIRLHAELMPKQSCKIINWYFLCKKRVYCNKMCTGLDKLDKFYFTLLLKNILTSTLQCMLYFKYHVSKNQKCWEFDHYMNYYMNHYMKVTYFFSPPLFYFTNLLMVKLHWMISSWTNRGQYKNTFCRHLVAIKSVGI